MIHLIFVSETKKVSGGRMDGNMQVGILQIQRDCPVVLVELGKHCHERFHPEVLRRDEHIDTF